MPRLRYIFVILLLCTGRHLFSQQGSIDSLVRVASAQKPDTNRIITWLKISAQYNLSGKLDSSNRFMQHAYNLAGKLRNIKYMVSALVRKATNLQDNGKVKDAEAVATLMMAKSDSAGYEAGRAAAYATLGAMSTMQSNFRQAEDYYLKAVTIYTKLGMKSKITGMYNSMGWVASGTGDYKKAVNYLLLAMESAQNDTNARLIGMVNLNLGELYAGLKEYDKALQLNKTAYDYYGRSGDIRGQALALGSIGNIYGVRSDIRQAISYFNAALALCYKTGYHTGSLVFLPAKNDLLLTVFKDIKNSKYRHTDSVLDLLGLPRQANRLELLKDSILLNQRRADSLNVIAKNSGSGNVLNSAKALYELVNGNYAKSIDLFIPCIAGAEASKDNNLLLRDYLYIAEAYQGINNFRQAYGYLKKYLQLNDSIGSDEKKKSVLKSQAEYEFKEKEFQLRSEKEKEKLVFDIEKGKQRTQRVYFIIILVLFAGGLAAVAVGYRRKSKYNSTILRQKEEIEKQKNIVDEKNKEVFDSIAYAKRLQKAILPPLSLVKQYLPEGFILYKPKDIVAGDFYWMHVSLERRDEGLELSTSPHSQPSTPNSQLILIAAADCTGHGVPGAIVSVVCSNALNRAVTEFGLTEPGKILDKTRELVIETFEKSEEKVNDGMDISLCSILRTPGEPVTLQWAGANNPLVYSKDNVLHELKANKQPIGIVEVPLPFTTHTLQLDRGDCVYLFTDGYLDQFGGPNGKKYKHKPFVALLEMAHSKAMNEQELLLNKELAGWKGNNDQVDDILVMGFKI